MSDGDKYVMEFSVAGAGLETLQGIESSLNSIAAKAGSIGQQSLDGLIGGFKEVQREAATFEDIEASLAFSFGKDNWKGVYADVKKDAANLTFTLQEVSDLAASLGKMKINPFGGDSADSQLFLGRTGERIRALEVLQDTADAAGKSTQDLTVAIRNAMSGQWVSLATRFDIPKEKINAWKKEVDKLSTSQEKYNLLVSKLAMDYGGAGKLKDMNWNKVSAQVPDLIQQLKGGAGSEGLRVMTVSLKEFVNAFSGMVKDEQFMKSLSNAFMLLAKGVAFFIEVGTKAIHIVRGIVTAFPAAPSILVVGAALTVVTGAVIGVTAAVVGLGMALTSIGLPVLFFLAAAAAAVVASFVAIVAIALLVTSAMGLLSGNVDGIAGSFERFKIVMEAVQEAISNWSGETTYVTEETKNRLDDIGMADTFLDIIGVLQRVMSFFQSFTQGFLAEWEVVGDPIKQSMRALFESFKLLGTALGMTFGGAKTDIANAKGEGVMFGQMMADAIKGIADVLAYTIGFVADLAANFAATASTLADWYFYAAYFWNTLQMVGDLLGGTVAVTASLVLTIFENILQVVEAIGIALKAAALGMSGDFEGAAQEWAKMEGVTGRMEKSWKETGKTFDTWTDKFAQDRADVDQAFTDSQKIADFGAKVQANMAAAKAKYAKSTSRYQPGMEYGKLTPEEIAELDKRSKYETQMSQPIMSIDRIGDAGYESYLARQSKMEDQSQIASKYDYTSDPYAKDRNQSTDYLQAEAYAKGMSARSPVTMSIPLADRKEKETQAPPPENMSGGGPNMSSAPPQPIVIQNRTTLQVDGRVLSEIVAEQMAENERRSSAPGRLLKDAKSICPQGSLHHR